MKDSKVIVFADTDNQIDPSVDKQNNSISDFCLKHGYQLVWFNRDIEEVFLGTRVHKHEKNKMVTKFLADNLANKIDVSRLSVKEPMKKMKHSNIYLILCPYFVKRP